MFWVTGKHLHYHAYCIGCSAKIVVENLEISA